MAESMNGPVGEPPKGPVGERPSGPVGGLDCDRLVELVTEFAEGALDARNERLVVDHLAICEGCVGYLEQMRATARALGALPSDRLPEDARAALLAALREPRD